MNKKNKIMLSVFGFLLMSIIVVGSTTIRDTLSDMAGINNTGNFITKDPWADVRAFGAIGDGVTDDTQAFQDAADSLFTTGGIIFIPKGTYNLTSSIKLNSSLYGVQYKIIGVGANSYLKPDFPNSGNTTYLFRVNIDDNDDYIVQWPIGQRCSIENLRVNGVNSNNASFIISNKAAVMMRDLYLSYLYYGLKTNGYTDRIGFNYIYWAYDRNGGWLYKQGSHGDGLFASQVFCDASNGFYLYKTAGGKMDSFIGGYHLITDSENIEISNGHFEGYGIEIHGSQVLIKNNYFHNSLNPSSIIIDDNDDSGYECKSFVTLDNNMFTHYVKDYNDTRYLDVNLTYISPHTRIDFKNNVGTIYMDGRWIFTYAGLKVESNISSINNTLSENEELLLSNSQLKIINGVWKLVPIDPFNNIKSNQKITGVNVQYIGESSTSAYKGELMSGNKYYYRMATYLNNYTIYSEKSGEVSHTLSNDNSCVVLDINAQIAPSIIRIWRGNSIDNYDRYVEFPISLSRVYLFDQGHVIGGYDWITSNIPSPPLSTNSWDGATITGTVKVINITLTSPDTNEWCCGVNNAGTFICTSGSC